MSFSPAHGLSMLAPRLSLTSGKPSGQKPLATVRWPRSFNAITLRSKFGWPSSLSHEQHRPAIQKPWRMSLCSNGQQTRLQGGKLHCQPNDFKGHASSSDRFHPLTPRHKATGLKPTCSPLASPARAPQTPQPPSQWRTSPGRSGTGASDSQDARLFTSPTASMHRMHFGRAAALLQRQHTCWCSTMPRTASSDLLDFHQESQNVQPAASQALKSAQSWVACKAQSPPAGTWAGSGKTDFHRQLRPGTRAPPRLFEPGAIDGVGAFRLDTGSQHGRSCEHL